jgi:hypothetical protein
VIAASGISGWSWVAFGGLAALLCLVGYGVVRVSRRPQRLGDVSLDQPVQIPLWRVKAVWGLVVMSGLLCVAVRSLADHGSAMSWAFVAVVTLLAATTASYAKDALRGRPAVVLDRDGLHDAASGRYVRWSDVRVARAKVRQGAFDEYHDLVVELRTDDPPVEIRLDELEMHWREVMQLVGVLSGQPTEVHDRRAVPRTSR